MIEVRWHGRGGQGAVTSVEMLALAAIGEGKPFWLNGREGFAALNLALSIVRSSSERRTVALEPAP